MLMLRDLLGFGNLTRVLIVAFGLGFGLGAPVDAVQPFGCALVGDCAVPPAEEPRESESLSLSLAFTAKSAERQQRIIPVAAKTPAQPPFTAASSFGERRDLRHVRGKENLSDKTGPPAA